MRELASGTWLPVGGGDVDVLERIGGLRWNRGSTSSTTWYWLSWVKMVDTWRWPKAS